MILRYLSILFLFGCTDFNTNTETTIRTSDPQKKTIPDSTYVSSIADSVLNNLILGTDKDIAKYIHSGLRFASIIHLESSDTILSVQNFIKEVENNSVIAWNIGDPSGEPNVLSYAEYKNKYLIPVKFIASEKRILHKPWHFNLSAQNIDKIYPKSWLVDYTREDQDAEPGNEYTSDWHSLIMVFLPYRKTWRLCAFVSNHYTP